MKRVLLALLLVLAGSFLLAAWRFDTLGEVSLAPYISTSAYRVTADSTLQMFGLRLEGDYIPEIPAYPTLTLFRQSVHANGVSVTDSLAALEVPTENWQVTSVNMYKYNGGVNIYAFVNEFILVFTIPDNGAVTPHFLYPNQLNIPAFYNGGDSVVFFQGNLYISSVHNTGLYKWDLSGNTIQQVTDYQDTDWVGVFNINEDFLLLCSDDSGPGQSGMFMLDATDAIYPQPMLANYSFLLSSVALTNGMYYIGLVQANSNMNWDWGLLYRNGNTLSFTTHTSGGAGPDWSYNSSMNPFPSILLADNRFIGIYYDPAEISPYDNEFRFYQYSQTSLSAYTGPINLNQYAPAMWIKRIAQDRLLACFNHIHYLVADLADNSISLMNETYPPLLNSYLDYSGDLLFTQIGNPVSGIRVSRVTSYVENEDAAEVAMGKVKLYPNPCCGTARLEFDSAQAGTARLSVYNAKGQLVLEPAEPEISAGKNEVTFDLRQVKDKNLPNGIYIVRLQAGEHSRTTRLLLLK
jgi:hypothetical protein